MPAVLYKRPANSTGEVINPAFRKVGGGKKERACVEARAAKSIAQVSADLIASRRSNYVHYHPGRVAELGCEPVRYKLHLVYERVGYQHRPDRTAIALRVHITVDLIIHAPCKTVGVEQRESETA